MEPENAQTYYSEQLICLPNLGIAYPQPEVPNLTKNRADFHIPDDSIVYLCCQNLIKYLPQYDYIWTAIAKQVPSAKFVFIDRRNTEIFRYRLQQSFSQSGLNYQDYCILLPFVEHSDYFNLNLLSDVFLDSFSWSGGHTTLEAIACHLPVVTCPGEFMRGRHSYAILKMLGVEETIAYTEPEYINIAIRLGKDSQWRQNIIEKIESNHQHLYDDTTCVRALEEFYQRIIQEKQQQES
jgi:predicted O-linked N-acetylglucosamine transferase (SPINDLY family)